MSEFGKNAMYANEICDGTREPEAWVSVEELEEIKSNLRLWHRATYLDRGVVSLAWQEHGQTRSVAARLN